MDEHMKAVGRRMSDVISKKGRSYAMKYLIQVAGWSEAEADQIVKYAERKEKPSDESDGIS